MGTCLVLTAAMGRGAVRNIRRWRKNLFWGNGALWLALERGRATRLGVSDPEGHLKQRDGGGKVFKKQGIKTL